MSHRGYRDRVWDGARGRDSDRDRDRDRDHDRDRDRSMSSRSEARRPLDLPRRIASFGDERRDERRDRDRINHSLPRRPDVIPVPVSQASPVKTSQASSPAKSPSDHST